MTYPIVPLELCEFNKRQGTLVLSSEYFGMPSEFGVRSHHTGKVVKFVPVQPGDELFDEDGWDGEMQIYRPVDCSRIDHMIIRNEW